MQVVADGVSSRVKIWMVSMVKTGGGGVWSTVTSTMVVSQTPVLSQIRTQNETRPVNPLAGVKTRHWFWVNRTLPDGSAEQSEMLDNRPGSSVVSRQTCAVGVSIRVEILMVSVVNTGGWTGGRTVTKTIVVSQTPPAVQRVTQKLVVPTNPVAGAKTAQFPAVKSTVPPKTVRLQRLMVSGWPTGNRAVEGQTGLVAVSKFVVM